MKKTYSIYIDDLLVEKILQENSPLKLSKLIEMSLAYYNESDEKTNAESKILFELKSAKQEIRELTFTNKTQKEMIAKLDDMLSIQTNIINRQSERFEEMLNHQNKKAQENYDSLLEQFRTFARINNNFNERELYFLNYLMLPFYKDITSYDAMPNYSLTNIYRSEKSLVAANARIDDEMQQDKEKRRNARRS